ncbi:hypothetical protein Dimus_031614 [Dionaea muscipula]
MYENFKSVGKHPDFPWLRSSSRPIEVVKPSKRRKERSLPPKKELEPPQEQRNEEVKKELSVESRALNTKKRKLVKRGAKEVAAEAQMLQVVDPPLMKKEHAEVVPESVGKE